MEGSDVTMANTTKPLTNTEIKQAKPRDKEFNLSDGQGLALRIKPNGSKLWLFNYSHPFSKKRINISLGDYPSLSLADARHKRREYRSLLVDDIDPKEFIEEKKIKSDEANQNSLEHITNLWLDAKSDRITEVQRQRIYRSLEIHIFPQLAQIPVHKLKARRVIDVLRPLAIKGTLETVRRLCQRLNEIMVYAVNSGIIESNCLTGISKAFTTPTVTNMRTIKPEELPALMKAISRASIKFTTRRLIEWQLHTMVRPGEAAAARWDEINLEEQVWIIPGKRMKKNRDHIVPLSKQTLEILEEMKSFSGHREFIFPADREPNKPSNSETVNRALKRMGYGGKLVSHGMRALASTTLNEEGFDADVIESALAHVEKNNVRRAYNRAEYLEPRKKLMCWWSEFIDSALYKG